MCIRDRNGIATLAFPGISTGIYGYPIGHAAEVAVATVRACLQADAVLLGAVGGPKWDAPTAPDRPERGLLAIRKALNLFANLRPVKLQKELIHASTIKESVLEGTDLLVIRELTGGAYFGPRQEAGEAGYELSLIHISEPTRPY